MFSCIGGGKSNNNAYGNVPDELKPQNRSKKRKHSEEISNVTK